MGERILLILTLTVNSKHEKGLFAVNNNFFPRQMLLQWIYLPLGKLFVLACVSLVHLYCAIRDGRTA